MGDKHYRQFRLPGYDYSSEGAYFITICTDNKIPYFCNIGIQEVQLTLIGRIVDSTWHSIPDQFPDVKLDEYQTMPDHFHGIIIINRRTEIPHTDRNMRQDGILNNPMCLDAITLGRIVRWFKARVSYDAKKLYSGFQWQRRFYDRVIRNDKELFFIREYIKNNPARWREKFLS